MKVIGIIGCGQLARMMALAGWPLGMSFSFVASATESDDCVRGLGCVVRWSGSVESNRDVAALYRAMGHPHLVTVEREDVDVTLLRALQQFCPVYPDPEAIAVCQHRGREKAFLNGLGIDTAPHRLADDSGELKSAVLELGLPVFVKSCEQGYDGRNQWRITRVAELDALLASGRPIFPCMVEAEVRFLREVSLIAVRSAGGEIAHYPVTENHHRNGVLLASIAPADGLGPVVLAQADRIAQTLLDGLRYVGVLAIECFVGDNGLLVNELAPRVHNSGHWTQLGAATGQFENHLRAVAGYPLGATGSRSCSGMINLLGALVPAETALAANRQLHLYNKSLKPGRKVGHINLCHQSGEALRREMQALLHEVYGLTGIDLPGMSDASLCRTG